MQEFMGAIRVRSGGRIIETSIHISNTRGNARPEPDEAGLEDLQWEGRVFLGGTGFPSRGHPGGGALFVFPGHPAPRSLRRISHPCPENSAKKRETSGSESVSA
jgi:hypothetical protein